MRSRWRSPPRATRCVRAEFPCATYTRNDISHVCASEVVCRSDRRFPRTRDADLDARPTVARIDGTHGAGVRGNDLRDDRQPEAAAAAIACAGVVEPYEPFEHSRRVAGRYAGA